ncbi:hypothetical protein [Stappia sp. MMSF_3263]|uniref:hypothetical protein n=1 Tax=Stappia sp. MMSF_3263 TaxID=3046693 RepID=UPI003014BBF4
MLRNRVAPDGTLHAVTARGTLMGNRGGRLHDPLTRTLGRARWRSRAWICCEIAFKDRHRSVMGSGYTEFFFLDEVTALAAGHRPCFECRRADALRFREAWARAEGTRPEPRAAEMDVRLHGERTGERPLTRLGALPDGAMARIGDVVATPCKGRLLGWSFDGYAPAPEPDPDALAELLTPPAIVSVLAAGYRPRWHESAGSIAG